MILSKNIGRLTVNFDYHFLGDDLCVIITGGDTPHIGAVCLSSGDLKTTNLTLPDHKEGLITDLVTKEIKKYFNNSLVVICGIHLNDITKQEIADCIEISKFLTAKLISEISA